VRLARKHIGWYSRGLPGSAGFRAQVNRLAEPAEVMVVIDRFYDPLIASGAGRARAVEGDEPEAEAA
jgi:tRNA-dihydrouridine synthase B